jgi:hypothetical protein
MIKTQIHFPTSIVKELILSSLGSVPENKSKALVLKKFEEYSK